MKNNAEDNGNGNRVMLRCSDADRGSIGTRGSGWRLIPCACAGLASLTIAMVLAACGSGNTDYRIPAEAQVARPSSTLAVGDVIRVSFAGDPKLDTTQKIGMNGQISLPTVGSVTASGRSVSSLQSQLTRMYEPHLANPEVLVAIENRAAAVYVSGEVNNPGKVPLDRSMTALEAIMESGGFSKFANPKQVFVIRNEKGRQRRYALNLGDTLAGVESQAFYLRPFDMIYVKQSNW